MSKLLLEVGADGIGESPQVVRYQGMLENPVFGYRANGIVRRCDNVNYTAGERYSTVDGTPHSYQAQSMSFPPYKMAKLIGRKDPMPDFEIT
jgi:hypothetical protein